MSWLYDHREQLDGYQLYAEIAYRFRPKVLPEGRDDVEMDIIIKLKEEAGRHTKVTPAFLMVCARSLVTGYWRKKYRERKRFCRLYEGDRGEMVTDRWEFVTPAPDIETKLDAKATLRRLPKSMIEVGRKRADGLRLNNADKLYLCQQRHRLSRYNWTNDEEIERMRHLYVGEGLSCVEVAKITGKGRSTVQRHLSRLGAMRKRAEY